MKKRVFLFHGWGASPKMGWYPKVVKALSAKGYTVVAPHMPGDMDPKPEEWIAKMNEIIGIPDEQTYLIGHSLGPTAILRYLEQLQSGQKIGGALFVAGGFHYTPENVPENLSEDPWYGRMPDFANIKPHLPKSVALFSEDDPIIVFDDKDIFARELGSRLIIHKDRGHFIEPSDDDVVLAAFAELEK